VARIVLYLHNAWDATYADELLNCRRRARAPNTEYTVSAPACHETFYDRVGDSIPGPVRSTVERDH
jgi:hypothetical protein